MEHRSNKTTTRDSEFTLNSIVGNMIPDIWYKVFLTKASRPDYVTINLLAEIVYWHKPSKFGAAKKFSGSHLNLKYSNLSSKLNTSKETIRRSFVKLEEKGVVKRIFQNISNRNTFCSNALFVDFDQKQLEKLCSSHKDFSFNKNINTNIASYDDIIHDENIKNTSNINVSVDSIEEITPKKIFSGNDLWRSSPQARGDVYREKKERIKANSLGLSFINFENKKDESVETKKSLEIGLDSVLSTQTPFCILHEESKENIDIVKKIREEVIEKEESVLPDQTSSTSAALLSASSTEDYTSKKALENLGKKDFEEISKSDKSSSSSSYKKRACYNFLPVSEDLCADLRAELNTNYPDSYFEEAIIRMIEMDKMKMNEGLIEKGTEELASELVPQWSLRQLRSRLLSWSKREFKSLDEIKERLGLISSAEALEAKEFLASQKKDQNYDNALLSRYEDSKDTSPIGRIKRKIAGSLPRELALTLLKNSNIDLKTLELQEGVGCLERNIETNHNQILSVKVRDISGILNIKTTKELLEPLAKSVIGEGALVDLEITNSLSGKSINKSGIYNNNSIILTDKRKKDLVENSFSGDAEIKEIQEFLLSEIGLDQYYSWFRDVGFDLQCEDSGHSNNKPTTLTVITDGKFKRDYLSNNYETKIRSAITKESKTLGEDRLSGEWDNGRDINIEFVESSEMSTKSVDKYVEQGVNVILELEVGLCRI